MRLWGREWRTSGRRSFVKVFLRHWKEGRVSVLLLKSYHDWLNAVYNKTRGFLNLIVWKLFSDFYLLNFIFSANWSMRYRFRFSKSVIPVIKQDDIKIEPSNLSCACQTNQFTGELVAGMMPITHAHMLHLIQVHQIYILAIGNLNNFSHSDLDRTGLTWWEPRE